MLIAHCADLHITERRGDSRATLEEQADLLRWIGKDAFDRGAQLLVCAGDVFDGVSTPAEREVAFEAFQRWAEYFPVVVVQGNHDRPGDLLPLCRLGAVFEILVADAPQTFPVGIVDKSEVFVACLPWPRKAYLAAARQGATKHELDAAVTSALRACLAGLQVDLDQRDGPRVLLAHVELGGARLDSGQPVAARCDVRIAESDLLAVGADYVAAGHIHQHQVLANGKICYAGSPHQCSFGEDAKKGYCLVDVRRGKNPQIVHYQGPARRLATALYEWYGSGLQCVAEPPIFLKGVAMRLTYSAPESARVQAAQRAAEMRDAWIRQGAHSVKLDPRIETEARIRSESISRARTTQDRVEAYWEATGRPERAEQIALKLSRIEAKKEGAV